MNLYQVTIVLTRDFKIVGRIEANDVHEARENARKLISQNLSRGVVSVLTVQHNTEKRYQVEHTYQDFEAGTPPAVTLLRKVYKSRKAAEEKASNLCWCTQPPGVDHPLSRSIGKVVEVPA